MRGVIIFVWRKHENISGCTGIRVITIYERIASCVGTQYRLWPVCQKRTGNSRIASHTRHSNEPTLSRNDSPLGCLHLELAFRYYFCMEETWEHVSGHWQQGNDHLWANWITCWNPVTITGLRISRQLRHPLLLEQLLYTFSIWIQHELMELPVPRSTNYNILMDV